MGTFSVDVELGGPFTNDFVTISALVNTGATYTAVPGNLLNQLGIQPRSTRLLRQADGQTVHRPLGQARMRLEGEEVDIPVIFLPENTSPLLGATALEIFGLIVDPDRQRLLSTEALLY